MHIEFYIQLYIIFHIQIILWAGWWVGRGSGTAMGTAAGDGTRSVNHSIKRVRFCPFRTVNLYVLVSQSKFNLSFNPVFLFKTRYNVTVHLYPALMTFIWTVSSFYLLICLMQCFCNQPILTFFLDFWQNSQLLWIRIPQLKRYVIDLNISDIFSIIKFTKWF